MSSIADTIGLSIKQRDGLSHGIIACGGDSLSTFWFHSSRAFTGQQVWPIHSVYYNHVVTDSTFENVALPDSLLR